MGGVRTTATTWYQVRSLNVNGIPGPVRIHRLPLPASTLRFPKLSLKSKLNSPAGVRVSKNVCSALPVLPVFLIHATTVNSRGSSWPGARRHCHRCRRSGPRCRGHPRSHPAGRAVGLPGRHRCCGGGGIAQRGPRSFAQPPVRGRAQRQDVAPVMDGGAGRQGAVPGPHSPQVRTGGGMRHPPSATGTAPATCRAPAGRARPPAGEASL
jgi:hypothetical protein